MKGWILIDNKRLKLYDTSIEVCINKKVKDKLRKIAYKQNITMSEYVRCLINFAIAYNDINNFDNKKKLSTGAVDKLIFLLGGNINE